MMNTMQLTSSQAGTYVKNAYQSYNLPSKHRVIQIKTNNPAVKSLRLRENPSFLKSRQPLPVCLAGGQGMMDNRDEGSPWKELMEANGKRKGLSIEDVLRQQIQTKEYSGNGGSGGKRPGGGGGSGGSEEGDFPEKLDETRQIVYATIGFILMYIYSISGVELTKLTRDYIKYLCTGKRSVRLKHVMHKWGRFYQLLTGKKVVDPDSSEQFNLDTQFLESN